MDYFVFPLLAVIVIPLVVYFSVKFGTYAYLRAQYLFRKNHSNMEEIQHEQGKREEGRKETFREEESH